MSKKLKTLKLSEDRFWKFQEIKVRFRAESWDELIDKLYKKLK